MSTPQDSGPRWEAPRTAYELAADWAVEADAQRGGPGVLLFPSEQIPAIGKHWHALGFVEQGDVLAALAAQVRSALWDLRRFYGMDDDDPVAMDLRYYTSRVCEQARAVLGALLEPGRPGPWRMPDCHHCAELVAVTLIDTEVNAMIGAGIADPAAALRILAIGPQVPTPRETHD